MHWIPKILDHNTQVVKGTANPDGPFSRGVQKGAAYIYRRSAATGLWYEETKLFLDDGEGTDRYGWQVGEPGVTIIVTKTMWNNVSQSGRCKNWHGNQRGLSRVFILIVHP